MRPISHFAAAMLVFCVSPAVAAPPDNATAEQIAANAQAEILGKQIYDHDQAAWRASDALRAQTNFAGHPEIGGYVTDELDDGAIAVIYFIEDEGALYEFARVAIDGAGDATEWRTNSGTRKEVDLRIADDFTTDDYWVRCRFKVTTAGTAKTYVHFNNEYMDDYEVWFDVTDDATTDAARVVHVGANVSDAVAGKHPTNGFIYVKFRINFSTQSDANGTNTINMSDQDNTGDNLMDVNNLTVIATQDYTFELIT